MKLNNESVGRLKLPDGKSEMIVFDKKLAGFGVRIRAGGKRTWICQYRVGTAQRRLTLGSVEVLDADEGRRRAKEALAKASLGHDPQAQRVERRAQAAITLGAVAETYLVRAEKRLKPRSLLDVQRHLRRDWRPMSQVALADIRRADVAARLQVLARDYGGYAANRARSTLSSLFTWAIGEGLADQNPVVGTNRACDEVSRDRVLTEKELCLIWRHAGDRDYADIIRLLILTGQRRGEVAGMRWDELDGSTWAIPASRTKNGRPHVVPLSTPGWEILGRRERRSETVFGAFNSFSHPKDALDARLQAAGGMAPWRVHDIRRTVATRLADLGTPPHVVEAILNHQSGSKGGVAGVYNRALYENEKRGALARWGTHVVDLIEGRNSNVVPLLTRQGG